jgi:hypothetical protein
MQPKRSASHPRPVFKKKVGKVFGFFIFGHFFCPFLKTPNTFGKKIFRKIMVREKTKEK